MADAKHQLGAELKRLREDAGLTQIQLAVAAGYASSGRSMISKAERAVGELPSPAFTEAIDRELGAGGRLVALRAGAWRDEQRGRVAVPARTLGTEGASGQGDTTDRRGLLVAAGTVTAAEAVRELAERVAMADPSPLTVAEIGARVQRAAEEFTVAPRAELRARLETQHLAVEALLDRRLSRRVRDQLTRYAGHYCNYLGWLAYSVDDDTAALAYLTMLQHHVAESGDPLLAGSAAILDIGLAPHTEIADIAERARCDARVHPYIRPHLAAREARGAARLGQPQRARAALAAMETTAWAGPKLPGAEPFDDEHIHFWTAETLNALGEGEAAEGHARSSLALLRGTGKPFLAAGTYGALAQAFLRRRTAKPEEAAAAAALDLQVGRNRISIERAGRTWRDLARWGNLPAIRDLGELVAEARAALPATV